MPGHPVAKLQCSCFKSKTFENTYSSVCEVEGSFSIVRSKTESGKEMKILKFTSLEILRKA